MVSSLVSIGELFSGIMEWDDNEKLSIVFEEIFFS